PEGPDRATPRRERLSRRSSFITMLTVPTVASAFSRLRGCSDGERRARRIAQGRAKQVLAKHCFGETHHVARPRPRALRDQWPTPDDPCALFAGKISDARYGWVDDRSMHRMMDMDLRKRPDRRPPKQGLDVIDEVLANDFVRSLIVHADLERSTDDEMIGARKHVSVLAIEILQIWLRRQHRQLALDGSHLGVAPQHHR